MRWVRAAVRFGYVPCQLILVNGLALYAIVAGANGSWLVALLLAAIALSFGAERVLPYYAGWNRSHGDAARDVAHAIVNEVSNFASLAVIPLFASAGLGCDVWPRAWPFALQVIAAIFVLDLGVTLCHYASHRLPWLWRFHAVHHSVERMYGFNGLMKHPVHQSLEMLAGTAPLIALGMPLEIATALAFCTAVQLLVQHANVDFRLGPLRGWLAAAEIHRLHHRRDAEQGDVNFGLFTTLGDRLLGTRRDVPSGLRLTSADLGIAAEPDHPRGYWAQLRRPFIPI